MFVKRLRRRLFGLKKSDVYDFIREMDESAAQKIEEKDNEIKELKGKIAELEEKRDAVINALQIADEKAKEMVTEAQKKADVIRAEAENEAKEKKEIVNREIEIKRKAIKNYYSNENKKIAQIKNEVERMRRASLDAIENFERQLREVERMTDNNSSYVDSAMNYAQTGSALEVFDDVEREIPIHIVESI